MRPTRLIALCSALMLVVAACGGGDDTTDDGGTATTAAPTTAAPSGGDTDDLTGLPVIDPLDAPSGDVAIAGSSTVFPLSTSA